MLVVSSKLAHPVSYSFYTQTYQKYSLISYGRNAVLCVQEKSWFRVHHPVLPFQAL